MNNQEREQLTRFLQQLVQAQVGTKDAEADRLIQEACSRQPTAHYLLVQRSLLLDHALEIAQAEITSLKRELDNTRSTSGGFLNSNAWGSAPAQAAAPQPASTYAPLTAAPVAPASTSSWGSGMLSSVATTAAGVVAGGFLFQGIEHLLGNRGSNSGLMNGLSSNVPIEHHEASAIDQPIDNSQSSSGLFDTSSVDSFIADDTDNNS